LLLAFASLCPQKRREGQQKWLHLFAAHVGNFSSCQFGQRFFLLKRDKYSNPFVFVTLGFNQYLNLAFSLLFGF
jgi:hypothetical protein